MLKKVEAKCKRFGKEFCRKRTAQTMARLSAEKRPWSDHRIHEYQTSMSIHGSIQFITRCNLTATVPEYFPSCG